MKTRNHPLVIVVSSRKGGVGKSTVACHLSVCAGESAVLVDADSQAEEGSSSAWAAARTLTAPAFVGYSDYRAAGVERVLELSGAGGASHIVIDTPPKADTEISALMRLADLNIVVTEPSFLALSALPRSLQLAQAAGKPVLIVVNKIKAQRLESAQARAALNELGVPVCEFSDLTDFARALANGRAVTEFAPRGRAAEQIRILWDNVQELTK